MLDRLGGKIAGGLWVLCAVGKLVVDRFRLEAAAWAQPDIDEVFGRKLPGAAKRPALERRRFQRQLRIEQAARL
ncbi:hypothetical protein D3C86_2161020 [compost metagenome]